MDVAKCRLGLPKWLYPDTGYANVRHCGLRNTMGPVTLFAVGSASTKKAGVT